MAASTVIESGSDAKLRAEVTQNKELKTYSRDAISSTGTVTSITVTSSSTQLLAVNSNRRGFFIFNDSGAVIYIKFSTGATTTSFSTRLANNEGQPYFFPYSGVIHAVRGTGSGTVQVTEFS